VKLKRCKKTQQANKWDMRILTNNEPRSKVRNAIREICKKLVKENNEVEDTSQLIIKEFETIGNDNLMAKKTKKKK